MGISTQDTDEMNKLLDRLNLPDVRAVQGAPISTALCAAFNALIDRIEVLEKEKPA